MTKWNADELRSIARSVIESIERAEHLMHPLFSSVERTRKRLAEFVMQATSLPRPSACDQKYSGVLFTRSGDMIPHGEFVVFRVKDALLLETLEAYRAECEMAGCGIQHLSGVNELLSRVSAWQDRNADKLKIPDTEPSDKENDHAH